MKCGSQTAVAIVGGYLLGRSHKTRLAVLMALMAAGGRLPVDPGELLRHTPLGAEGGPLDKLTGDLRTQLVDAGKSVAMAAATAVSTRSATSCNSVRTACAYRRQDGQAAHGGTGAPRATRVGRVRGRGVRR